MLCERDDVATYQWDTIDRFSRASEALPNRLGTSLCHRRDSQRTSFRDKWQHWCHSIDATVRKFCRRNEMWITYKLDQLIKADCNLFSMTGTSTACNVFGRSREPGFNAPQPAAQPNLPRKSSFFSGKQIGAGTININIDLWSFEPSFGARHQFTYMRHIMHRSFQCQYRHIKTVCLRCELEIWMHIDFAHPKCVGWQWFHSRIDDIVTECHMHLPWTSTGHAMAGGNHVSTTDQRTATSGKQRPNVFSGELCAIRERYPYRTWIT